MRKFIYLLRCRIRKEEKTWVKHCFCCLSLILYTSFVFAGTDIASNGSWNSAASWSSGTTPASGDTLLIPSGVIMNVNCNCGTYSNMRIEVYGTLNFPGGKKINLSSNGQIDVYSGGKITGSNNGDKINIGSNTVWTGSQPDVNGPVSCDNGGCETNATLPVEFLGLSTDLNGDFLRLDWSTATELNNEFFTLEYSEDYEQWFEETRILGSGTSQIEQHYSYEFDISKRNVEIKYVRLSQTDFDGTTKFLAHQSINSETQKTIRFYPNPASEVIHIYVPDKSVLEILTTAGNLLITIELDIGVNQIKLPDKLQAGLYFLEVKDLQRQTLFKEKFLKL